jgi:putative endonuclease
MVTFKLANQIGKIGEDTACVFLMKHGFRVICRNYWKKWGEIDIVAEKDGITRFVEVKSISVPNLDNVKHETGYRPEENVHFRKQQRLSRVIETYIAENGVEEGKW